MIRRKNAQIEMGFNWIYILIAGAVILMFFVGIVIRQKAVSEQKLSATVLREIETIFTGAGLAEKSVFLVNIPELTLQFKCSDDGYSEYAVKGTSVAAETPWQPIFSPKEMKTSTVLTWTLEWKMPFKVINYLMISSPRIKYYIFSDEYVLPEGFNQENGISILDYNSISYNNEEQIRLAFFGNMPGDKKVPIGLVGLRDNQVTAMEVILDSIIFYEKVNDIFVQKGSVPVISSYSVDNPNIYGAILSNDIGGYQCNLRKAFRRLEILSDIYGQRTEMINNHYKALIRQPDLEECGYILESKHFDYIRERAESCSKILETGCAGINSGRVNERGYGGYILQKNEELNAADCTVVY